MSDTPRIDATQYQWTRTLDLARTLERELAAVTRERETAYARGLEEGRKDLAAITRDWDEGAARERIAELARERNEARETVDYRNALVRSLVDSLKKIAFMARTSGGWKPDAELIAACEQAEQLLSLPGMSKVIDERDALRAEVERLTSAKDGAYEERNRCVALIARMAVAMGYRAGIAKTAIEGWSEDWHSCVYIDLPTGQASWHYHDTHAHLFEGLPQYAAPWDGHDTPEKYRRVDAAREFRSAEVERLRGALGGIRDRDFKLSDAKRRAQRALLATEALQEPTR